MLRVPTIYLEPRHLRLVEDILQRHASGRTVWVFGSRATGKLLKPFSDLDLAVEGRFNVGERIRLLDAFDESLLPIKVDIVELELTTPEFRERIERDFVPLQRAP